MAGVILASVILGCLLFTFERPAHASGTVQEYVNGTENNLIRGLSEGTHLGPGMFEGSATASPTILRIMDPEMMQRMYSFHFQNMGDTTLMLIQHTVGASKQVSQIPPANGMTIVLSIGSGESLQLLGLGDGSESRFVWSAREM